MSSEGLKQTGCLKSRTCLLECRNTSHTTRRINTITNKIEECRNISKPISIRMIAIKLFKKVARSYQIYLFWGLQVVHTTKANRPRELIDQIVQIWSLMIKFHSKMIIQWKSTIFWIIIRAAISNLRQCRNSMMEPLSCRQSDQQASTLKIGRIRESLENKTKIIQDREL